MKKKYYIEILRIIALIFVFYNHTGDSGFFLYTQADSTFLRVVYFSASFLCRSAVPIYFMISGSLLLGRKEDYKSLYKRISRIICVIILFSFFNYLFLINDNRGGQFNFFNLIKTIYSYEMIQSFWYLYYYLGFLLFLPFLRKMIELMDQVDYLYFFFISFIFQFVFPIINFLFNTYYNNMINTLFLEWLFIYPVLAYYFDNIISLSKCKQLLFVFYLLSFSSILLTYFFTKNEVVLSGDIYSQKWMSVFILMPTISIYLSVKIFLSQIHLPKFVSKIIFLVGSSTFGCYLINEILLKLFYTPINILFSEFIGPLLSCLSSIVFTIFIGVILIYIIKKIPFIKKLL